MSMTPAETLAFVDAMRAALSPAAKRVLGMMLAAEEADRYEDAEIIRDGREVWVGEHRTNNRVLNDLLAGVLVHAEEPMGAKIERFTLNEDGRAVAKAERNTKP